MGTRRDALHVLINFTHIFARPHSETPCMVKRPEDKERKRIIGHGGDEDDATSHPDQPGRLRTESRTRLRQGHP